MEKVKRGRGRGEGEVEEEALEKRERKWRRGSGRGGEKQFEKKSVVGEEMKSGWRRGEE